ncbi:MAG: mannose-1-phosphate guanylyltransferase, partial [bacterium]|nr:mannose-1-phosphate guanylyltransferase [bacterium]
DGLMEIDRSFGTSQQQAVLQRVYCQIKSISIDYGVMEHSDNVCVVKGDFNWNDVGSWDEVYKISPKDQHKNVVSGNHLLKDTKGCLIDCRDRFVAAIGVENLIVVETEDALLICPRDRAQDVKDMVELMKRKNFDQYL